MCVCLSLTLSLCLCVDTGAGIGAHPRGLTLFRCVLFVFFCVCGWWVHLLVLFTSPPVWILCAWALLLVLLVSSWGVVSARDDGDDVCVGVGDGDGASDGDDECVRVGDGDGGGDGVCMSDGDVVMW
mgnify:CR=1 FL=1